MDKKLLTVGGMYIYVIYFMYGGLYMVYGTYGICSMVVAMTIRLPTVGSWPGGSLNQIGIFPPLCIFPHFVYLSVIIFYNLSHITNSKISTISYIVMLATDCMSLFEGIRFVNCIRKQWSGVGWRVHILRGEGCIG